MTDPLLTILENERRYVARELHDGVAQTTLQLGLQAGICRKLLERRKLKMLAQELAELEARIQLAASQMREMIADLRPPQVGPEAGLSDYIQYAVETHLERGGPPVELHFDGPNQLRLSELQILTLTRIVQEALLNVRKHAQAQNVRLTLRHDDPNFYVTVADNGAGFDPAQVEALSPDKQGAGLANLSARAQALGGSLTIARDPTGVWTEVTVTLPRKVEG